MADEFDIQQSLQDQSDDFLMQNRQFAWIADSNKFTRLHKTNSEIKNLN